MTTATQRTIVVVITKQEVIMHYNLWFNNNLVEGLEQIMEDTGKKRNTVVREAVEKYIEEWKGSSWPEEIKNFKGIEGFSEGDRFENYRMGLTPSRENIFGEKK